MPLPPRGKEVHLLSVLCSVSDTVTALQLPPWQPQAGSLSVTAALFALALGYFLSGVTAAATAYSVHTVLPGWLHTGGLIEVVFPALGSLGRRQQSGCEATFCQCS